MKAAKIAALLFAGSDPIVAPRSSTDNISNNKVTKG